MIIVPKEGKPFVYWGTPQLKATVEVRKWPQLYRERTEIQENRASIMASATPFVSLCEAKAPQHLRQEAFEDSDIMRSAHKWPTR